MIDGTYNNSQDSGMTSPTASHARRDEALALPEIAYLVAEFVASDMPTLKGLATLSRVWYNATRAPLWRSDPRVTNILKHLFTQVLEAQSSVTTSVTAVMPHAGTPPIDTQALGYLNELKTRQERYAGVIRDLVIKTDAWDEFGGNQTLQAFSDLYMPNLRTVDIDARHFRRTSPMTLRPFLGRNVRSLVLGVHPARGSTNADALDLVGLLSSCPRIEIVRLPYINDPDQYLSFLKARPSIRTVEFGDLGRREEDKRLIRQIWTKELARFVATQEQFKCLRIETGTTHHPEAKFFVSLAKKGILLFPGVQRLAIGGLPSQLGHMLPALSPTVDALTVEIRDPRREDERGRPDDTFIEVFQALGQLTHLRGLVIRLPTRVTLTRHDLDFLRTLHSLLWLEICDPAGTWSAASSLNVERLSLNYWTRWMKNFPKIHYFKCVLPPRAERLEMDFHRIRRNCPHFKTQQSMLVLFASSSEPIAGFGTYARAGISFADSDEAFPGLGEFETQPRQLRLHEELLQALAEERQACLLADGEDDSDAEDGFSAGLFGQS